LHQIVLVVARFPLAALFLAAGYGHFASPDKFIGIMRGLPLPALHAPAMYATGVLEALAGVALALQPSEHVCNAVIALVLLMSPANVNMWWNDVPFGRDRLKYGTKGFTHALRFALQLALIAWLYALGRAARGEAANDAAGAKRAA
jgi:uncharacterized membrane protein